MPKPETFRIAQIRVFSATLRSRKRPLACLAIGASLIGACGDASGRTTDIDVSSAKDTPSATVAQANVAQDRNVAANLKLMAPSLTQLGARSKTFVATLSDDELDQLANDACESVKIESPESEIRARHDALTQTQRDSLAYDDWVAVYGLMLNFYCPEHLTSDLTQGIDLAGEPDFRASYAASSSTAEVAAFISGLGDERLDALQQQICGRVEKTFSNTQLASAILTSRRADLNNSERESISTAGYAEFFGAVLGHYCDEKQPGSSK